MAISDFLRARAAAREATKADAAHLAESKARFVARRALPPAEPAEPAPIAGRAAAKILEARVREDPAGWQDIRRIVGLPVRFDLSPEELEVFNRENLLADAYDRGFRLWPKQAEAVMAYDMDLPPFCPIGCGWGKTLITLMIAARAYRRNRIVLLITTPSVYEQLVETDIPWARSKVPLNLPFYYLGRKPAAQRKAVAKARRKGCYVIPNSLLSARDASEFLTTLRPDTIIYDEAHTAANSAAARTKRVKAYMNGADLVAHEGMLPADLMRLEALRAERGKVEFVPLSGTMTKKSIRDYHHLLKWALREGIPLPLSAQMNSEWAAVLDAGAGEPSSGATGPVQPLVEWARRNFRAQTFAFDTSGIRHAYQARLTATPGVVATGDNEIGTTLVVANRPIVEPEKAAGWEELQRHLTDLDELWVTPNGDEIEHAIHTFKWAYELSAGFYNQLTWPVPEALAERREIGLAEATDLLERANQHHAAHQEYAKALRKWTEAHAKAGLDTPMLIGQDMHRNGAKNVGDDLYQLWLYMKGLEFKGMPERDSTAIRVSPYKRNAAVEWAKALPPGTGAILWVHHQEMGLWVAEGIREAGLPLAHCPAGDEFNKLILAPETSQKIVVASIKAHGVGKNLQAFEHNYVVQWPRSPVDAEQLLSRFHRNGTQADELVAQTNHTTDFDFVNFAACVNDALYIHTTLGSRQKLIYANYDPLPKIFPPEVLRERGMQNQMLNREQRRMMTEKFGPTPDQSSV